MIKRTKNKSLVPIYNRTAKEGSESHTGMQCILDQTLLVYG
jgi:hypothetical protein